MLKMPRTILAGVVDSQSPAKAPTAHLLMQIRHNLVVPEKPFFRRGRCVVNAAHYFKGSETQGFWHEADAAEFSGGRHGGERRRGRRALAARPRSLCNPGGAGRARATCRYRHQFCPAK